LYVGSANLYWFYNTYNVFCNALTKGSTGDTCITFGFCGNWGIYWNWLFALGIGTLIWLLFGFWLLTIVLFWVWLLFVHDLEVDLESVVHESSD